MVLIWSKNEDIYTHPLRILLALVLIPVGIVNFAWFGVQVPPSPQCTLAADSLG